MNYLEEIKELEAKGVFIHYSHEHYPGSGTNCMFQIEFTKHPYPNRPEKCYMTGAWGDNHEFGDTADAMEASVKIAKWLLEGDRLEWFFFSAKETVTEEGHALWMKGQKMKDEFHKMLVDTFPKYAEFSKFWDDYKPKSDEA